jgi:hypothetical protein
LKKIPPEFLFCSFKIRNNNYLKRTQKSKSLPGGGGDVLLQTVEKQKTQSRIWIIIALTISGFPP